MLTPQDCDEKYQEYLNQRALEFDSHVNPLIDKIGKLLDEHALTLAQGEGLCVEKESHNLNKEELEAVMVIVKSWGWHVEVMGYQRHGRTRLFGYKDVLYISKPALAVKKRKKLWGIF